MATTLRWQDVAGQVRAADYSGVSDMITKGVSTLGQSIAAIGGQGDALRKAEAAKQLQAAQLAAGLNKELGASTNQFFNDQTVRTEKKDAKEFGANQSTLEALARKSALEGKSYDEFLQSDAYLKLGEGARAYGAANLSDAYMRGDETRMNQQERAADNARAQANADRSFRLQQDSASRQNRELDLRLGQLKKAERDALIAQGILSQDPETNLAISERRSQVAQQLAPLARGRELYGDLSPREAAEKGGLNGNWWADGGAEAQNVAKKLGERLGKKVEPWMVNQLLVEGGGADRWGRLNPGGNLNNRAAEEYLLNLVQLQDAAVYNHNFLTRMEQNALSGQKYDAERLNREFAVMTGVAPPPVPERATKPKPGPTWAPALPGEMPWAPSSIGVPAGIARLPNGK